MKIKNLLSIIAVSLLFVGCLTGNEIPAEDDDDTKPEYTYTPLANGEIIGYAAGWTDAPTDEQLDMLTHVMVFQILPNSDGSLDDGAVLRNLDEFVERAHSKNVKVSIAVGGWVNDISPNHTEYASAVSSKNRKIFVNNIVDFVKEYNLDGVDIDWEFPQGKTQWNDFIALLNDLKLALPNKRISCALQTATPNNSNFPGDVRSKIWTVADAIHLMTYDNSSQWTDWPTHSDAGKSNELIDDWANWGKDQPNFDKRKLVVGCAFYPKYETPGDNPESLAEKVNHCYDNGYGGVMIWELSDDLPDNTLLTAIYDATEAKGGYVVTN